MMNVPSVFWGLWVGVKEIKWMLGESDNGWFVGRDPGPLCPGRLEPPKLPQTVGVLQNTGTHTGGL